MKLYKKWNGILRIPSRVPHPILFPQKAIAHFSPIHRHISFSRSVPSATQFSVRQIYLPRKYLNIRQLFRIGNPDIRDYKYEVRIAFTSTAAVSMWNGGVHKTHSNTFRVAYFIMWSNCCCRFCFYLKNSENAFHLNLRDESNGNEQ